MWHQCWLARLHAACTPAHSTGSSQWKCMNASWPSDHAGSPAATTRTRMQSHVPWVRIVLINAFTHQEQNPPHSSHQAPWASHGPAHSQGEPNKGVAKSALSASHSLWGRYRHDTSPEVCQTWLLWDCQPRILIAPVLGKGSIGKWRHDGARMYTNMWLEVCQKAVMVKWGLSSLFLTGYQPKATYTEAGYQLLCSGRDLAALWWMTSCCPATLKPPLNQAASAQKHSITTFKSHKAIHFFLEDVCEKRGQNVLNTQPVRHERSPCFSPFPGLSPLLVW